VACGAQAPANAAAPKPQFDHAPPVTIDPSKTYTAVMKTSCGTINIELLSKTDPVTVNSFVFLAQKGYFDGQHFLRLDTSIDVVQGGDPTGTGSGGPGYAIPDELSGSETYPPGTVAMANAGPNTGGSQFFIITGPNGHVLDSNNAYPVFGKIVGGLDVAQRIIALPTKDPQAAAAGDPTGQQPKQAVYIESVTIKES
jgi:cyclophilin family peptidyl-prolyl cis-trans isomerase